MQYMNTISIKLFYIVENAYKVGLKSSQNLSANAREYIYLYVVWDWKTSSLSFRGGCSK